VTYIFDVTDCTSDQKRSITQTINAVARATGATVTRLNKVSEAMPVITLAPRDLLVKQPEPEPEPEPEPDDLEARVARIVAAMKAAEGTTTARRTTRRGRTTTHTTTTRKTQAQYEADRAAGVGGICVNCNAHYATVKKYKEHLDRYLKANGTYTCKPRD
jgi:hypothetical protein